MIKRLEAEDIIKLRNLDDHIEQFFPCSKSEWNQWLMANIDNPDTLIIGDEKHYLVAINTIQKPLSDHIFIIFYYSRGNYRITVEMKEMVEEWAREKGTKHIRFLCRNIKPFRKYGAEEKGIVGGWDI
ncbi:MAG: hypothetical protein ACTSPB_19470 [Candidatus Thorarchaeota archaeon]